MMDQYKGFANENYFACTLGEAQRLNGNHQHFETVSSLIEIQAKQNPNNHAVGFPVPTRDGNSWGSQIFTFKQLNEISSISKKHSKRLKYIAGDSKTIALLCPSSTDFLVSWLRLMKEDYAVLIIAPQCNPEAISHLCKSCDAHALLYHEMYADLASAAAALPGGQFQAIKIPWSSNTKSTQDLEDHGGEVQTVSNSSKNDIAYIFHTSGTSSGLPKPIPQNHHGAVGVLPSLDGKDSATFTTTPLYHGGISDCLRAWSSSALIWLFPGADLPITTKNILACLSTALRSVSLSNLPPVKYFSGVPYILEMLAMDREGLAELRSMDMVGVGGAALAPNVGDGLVRDGVRLLSRFGSAECGFLLSSNRQFETDLEWQYLRLPDPSPHLKFEAQSGESGLCELIILKDWPHMSKRNRSDGSFATSDLFEPHPEIKGAWRYHSRGDSQITLITGKKFDPAPLEDAIRSALDTITDVLVVGTGKQEPAALVIPIKDARFNDDKFEENVWAVIKGFNEKGQAHTRIARSMIKFLPLGTQGLAKSSKGTIQRKKAEERFAREIADLYNDADDSNDEISSKALSDEKIRAVVEDIVQSVVGLEKSLSADDDFYQFGLDSSQCNKIRSALQKKLPLTGDALAWNVVYDCGNINRLAQYMIDRCNGSSNLDNAASDHRYMLDLVDRFGTLETSQNIASLAKSLKSPPSLVLLTGATGSLGAHILHILQKSPKVSKIVCLVRASSHQEAHYRVSRSLIARKKPSLAPDDDKVLCVSARYEKPEMWNSTDLTKLIKETCGMVIHAAWPVNFSIPLKSFEDQLQSLHNLLELVLSCRQPPKFLFCSSTASVLGPRHPIIIPEVTSNDPGDADGLGYSRSKWVAESICTAAGRLERMKGKVKILRIGQLTGDTENGIWNMSEAWPLMLSTVNKLGCLPRLDEELNWLPVDIAAKAIVEIGTEDVQCEADDWLVYHIINTKSTSQWLDLLTWFRQWKYFDIVQLDEWLEKLEKLQEHPAKNLAWLWKQATVKDITDKKRYTFDVQRAEKSSAAMRAVGPINQNLAKKIWNWLQVETSGRESKL